MGISKLIHTAEGCESYISYVIDNESLYGLIDVGTEITCNCEKIYALTFSGNNVMIFKGLISREEIKIELKYSNYDG